MAHLNLLHFAKHRKASYDFHLPNIDIVNYRYSKNLCLYLIASNQAFAVDFYHADLSETAQREIITELLGLWHKCEKKNEIIFISPIFQPSLNEEKLSPLTNIHTVNYAGGLEKIKARINPLKIAI